MCGVWVGVCVCGGGRGGEGGGPFFSIVLPFPVFLVTNFSAIPECVDTRCRVHHPHAVLSTRTAIHQACTALQQRHGERLRSATRQCCAPPPELRASRRGSDLALAQTRCLKKSRTSSDDLPPVSQARTTKRARPCSSLNSGYLRSLMRRAWSRAAASRLAHCLRGAPLALTGLTKVVSMANWAPWKRGKPSATTSRRRSSNRPSGKRSRSWMLVDTLAPASAGRCTQHSSPANTLGVPAILMSCTLHRSGHGNHGWPQKADERESRHQKRRKRRMRKHCESSREAEEVGEQWKGIPAIVLAVSGRALVQWAPTLPTLSCGRCPPVSSSWLEPCPLPSIHITPLWGVNASCNEAISALICCLQVEPPQHLWKVPQACGQHIRMTRTDDGESVRPAGPVRG